MSYRHTQLGTVTTPALAAGTAVAAFFALTASGHYERLAASAMALLLASSLACFGALRVEVDREAVRLRFGIGWPAKRLPLERIAASRQARIRWWYGWGIRLVPGGWMWNVGGLEAVELVLADGTSFLIGTDEPERLWRAIESPRAARA